MMRADRILAAAFAVIVCTGIVGFSAGQSGATFTASSTNPSNSWNTVNVQPPASQSAPVSAASGVVNLSWTASPTSAGTHTLTYLVLRGPVGGPYTQIGTTPSTTLTYSDTPPADGTYQYVIQTKLAQGSGFFTSSNSATGNGISDRTAPSMSITCNGAACSTTSWYNAAVTVAVTGTDAGVGMTSGSVTYSKDGGANVVTSGGTVSFTLSGDSATHSVAYFGQDSVGNASGTTTVSPIKIDTTAPTAATGITTAKGLSAGQIALTWTAGTDALSGVSGYTIHRSGVVASCPAANTTNYPNATTVGAVTSATISGLVSASKYCFYLTTTDNAGNVSVASATAGPQAAK